MHHIFAVFSSFETTIIAFIPLGFLSLQDKLLPGNLGVWDQHAALKWVFQNINRFGGDAQRITIAGHEAGGTSVGLHILAPASHGTLYN